MIGSKSSVAYNQCFSLEHNIVQLPVIECQLKYISQKKSKIKQALQAPVRKQIIKRGRQEYPRRSLFKGFLWLARSVRRTARAGTIISSSGNDITKS